MACALTSANKRADGRSSGSTRYLFTRFKSVATDPRYGRDGKRTNFQSRRGFLKMKSSQNASYVEHERELNEHEK